VVQANLRAEEDAVVENFVAHYRPAVTAILHGFDRLVFRICLNGREWGGERG
jgi:hypothetical protein